jgi:phosphatidylglycerol---prolipoprotein diacylglyceryl transferase
MALSTVTNISPIGFPRYVTFGATRISSYKVFLILGIYAGSLAAAALAQSVGRSPLRVGIAAMACALLGFAGARAYHVAVYASHYLARGFRRPRSGVESGGWSLFGALLTFVPAAAGAAWLLGMPLGDLLDDMSGGVLAGGVWIRLGCVFNGCCAGRETRGPLGVVSHDVYGRRKVRLPVQALEIAWWLLGGALFLALWPTPAPAGSYALGVLGWYGFGRFFLEPMREAPDVVFGRVRINQVVAAALALGALVVLVARA